MISLLNLMFWDSAEIQAFFLRLIHLTASMAIRGSVPRPAQTGRFCADSGVTSKTATRGDGGELQSGNQSYHDEDEIGSAYSSRSAKSLGLGDSSLTKNPYHLI